MDDNSNPLPDDAITTGAAANLLRVHPSTIYRWALRGDIPAWRSGGRILVSRADVLAKIERVKGAKPAPLPVNSQKELDAWTQRVLKEHKLID